jgi:hypothetical protein
MSDRIRIATRKGLFTATRRAAGDWAIDSPAFLGDPVTAVLDDPRDGTCYAALNLGHFGVKLRRSRDDGRSWEEVAAPVYPTQPEGAEGPPWKLVLVWVLEADTGAPAGTLYAGTIPGGLFRSTDHGENWTLLRGLWDRPERLGWFGGGYDQPGIHSVTVDPRGTGRVGIGISCGGVWSSEDRGARWTLGGAGLRAAYMPPDASADPNVQDVHRVVQCRAAPDVLWAQHHNGIFRSTDAGVHWQEITTAPLSSFGFAAAVHPDDPLTAWFVPAVKDERRVPVDGRMAVTRTRDGGATFEVLDRGLPTSGCYDLVYRHGLDVDRTGRRLAMGSTTGSLWVSENGGDDWRAVSHHLPPIAAVRFVP